MVPPERAGVTTWAKRGALVGAAFFAGLLALHLAQHGAVRARYGCVIGPEQRAINLWASAIEEIAPNPWVHPQRFGEPPPPGDPEPPTDRWNAPAWLACGLLGYALASALLGGALGLVLARRA
ncbi:MAG TPA: hypothetical protein VFG69_15180 [Nannocystaceae bacterium]|nr:hypothetical protein [Nannocystaceae bacterium]